MPAPSGEDRVDHDRGTGVALADTPKEAPKDRRRPRVMVKPTPMKELDATKDWVKHDCK